MTEKGKELVKVKELNARDILLKYSWPEQSMDLVTSEFQKDIPVALLQLAIHCYDIGLSEAEMLVIIDTKIKRWEPDYEVNVTEVMASAKALSRANDRTEVMTFGQLLKAEFKVEWVIPGLLTETGVLCISGEPGVGKTQAMLGMCIAICTGTNFLGFKVEGGPRKVLFFSLEMIGAELKEFCMKMASGLSEEQLALVNENLIIYPLGMQLYLNVNETREEYWRIINEVNPAGVIIDSWSMAVMGNLSDDTVTREAMAFVNAVRKYKGCFWGIINHNKKKQADNEKPTSMDDIFGSRFFTAALSNAIVMWKHHGGNGKQFVEFHFVKSRFSPLPDKPVVARRTEALHYEVTDRGVADSALTKILGTSSTPSKKKDARKELESTAMGALLGESFIQHMPKPEVEMPPFDPGLIGNGDGFAGVEI